MNTQDQRIALAEWAALDRWVLMKRELYYRPNACGYTYCIGEAWILTETEADKHTYPHDEPVTKHRLPSPDYPSDLNAVHELEKKIRENQFHYVNYPHSLFEVVTGKKWDGDIGYFMFTLINATAAQRCEALCRVLWPQKWEP